MKPEKKDWQYRFLDAERPAIIDAAPSPLPEAIDFAAAISELENSRRAFITASAPARRLIEHGGGDARPPAVVHANSGVARSGKRTGHRKNDAIDPNRKSTVDLCRISSP